MKRPRKPVCLSPSVHHRLNMYALAASAAGAGVLALAQEPPRQRLSTQRRTSLSIFPAVTLSTLTTTG